MGLSFAKSIKVGALRFNFSKGGIGVSVGIPGLRVGIGPRGAYIGGGAQGFRYRQSISAKGKSTRKNVNSQGNDVLPSYAAPSTLPDIGLGENIASFQEHDTQCVLELNDCTDHSLLSMLNDQGKKANYWPFVLSISALIWAFLFFNPEIHAAVKWLAFVIGASLTTWVHWKDQARKLSVLFFDLDDQAKNRYEQLHEYLSQLAQVRKLKTVKSSSQYIDTRYTAGAGQGLSFTSAKSSIGNMPNIVSNVSIPMISSDKTTLAFCPDRILLFQNGNVGAIEYVNVAIESNNGQFVEREAVPGDAKVVGRTWKYVNKNGSPDRRFKDNHEIPVCLYNFFRFSSRSGAALDLRFMASKAGAFDQLSSNVAGMAHK